jgi:hypothetical protein
MNNVLIAKRSRFTFFYECVGSSVCCENNFLRRIELCERKNVYPRVCHPFATSAAENLTT